MPLISLIRHDGDRRLGDVMDPDVVYFSPHDPAEEAGHAFERYDLVSAPVVDEHLRVIGRLRVEAIMDYLRIRAEEQALAKAGLSGDTDLLGPIWEGARERWPWLCVNLLTAFVASRFISLFEGTIQQLVALATLMPIVASIGGNTGNQTAALLIRGLALNHVHRDTLTYIYRKEVTISLINGLLWGSVLGVFAWILYGNPLMGMVMAAAVTLNLIVAALIGITIPVLLDRLDRDPAMGSSVVLTFATDSMGFFLFLGLATLVLV
ncbi:MAG: magnesium transporter [Gammaproteobacteria bacterium]